MNCVEEPLAKKQKIETGTSGVSIFYKLRLSSSLFNISYFILCKLIYVFVICYV